MDADQALLGEFRKAYERKVLLLFEDLYRTLDAVSAKNARLELSGASVENGEGYRGRGVERKAGSCKKLPKRYSESEPVIDERRFPDDSPGNYRNDIYIGARPSIIQESDILLSTKKIASCDGQPGYGDSLRSKSCFRYASSAAQIDKRRLLEALTIESTP
jgi:hypothetical protein